MKRRKFIGGLIALATIPARANSQKDYRHSFERPLMGTRFLIRCHHEDADLAKRSADAAFLEAEKINTVASDYIADSELLQLCRKPHGHAVELSPLLFRLLHEARTIAEKTEGYFDPTLGPLTKLWRESRRIGKLPAADAIEKARAACGWQHLYLDTKTQSASLALPNMRLDLGAIAKGQAADAMFAIMQANGIPRSSIVCGGDIRVGTGSWKIGVKTFFKDQESRQIELSEAAVSTSGDLQQCIEIEGKRYSHIINPITGLGQTRRVAATVIAPNAALSDALATACCTAPQDKAELIARRSGATSVYRLS
jgi:FAD:protein FMN transferase